MDETQFNIAFYAAKFSYFDDTSGGSLEGYETVEGAVWRGETTGF